MSQKLAVQEESNPNQLPQDASKALEILQQIEEHTANLRKIIMEELTKNKEKSQS